MSITLEHLARITRANCAHATVAEMTIGEFDALDSEEDVERWIVHNWDSRDTPSLIVRVREMSRAK